MSGPIQVEPTTLDRLNEIMTMAGWGMFLILAAFAVLFATSFCMDWYEAKKERAKRLDYGGDI